MARSFLHVKVGFAAAALAAAALAGCKTSPTNKPAAAALSLKPCTVAGVSARCATLQVPQNRAAPAAGATMDVRVAVIPAQSPKRQPDPIVWFAGGPGDSAVDMADRVRPLVGSVTDRDLVLIEQRGTGASNVTCKQLPGLDDKAALRSAVASCLRGLKADLRLYSTAAFADDVDQALTALRYDTVNLVGISYGATAEQVFLTRHPARVRTMTLLSGTLLTIPIFEQMPVNAQRALNGLLDECARQPDCHRAFPNLKAEWVALWKSVRQRPWVVPAQRSPSGQRLVLDADWAANGIHRLLFTASTQADLPVVVHTLATSADQVAALLAISAALPPSTDTSDTIQVLALATLCGEPWARRDPSRLAGADSFEYHSDLASAQWWQYVCGLIPGVQPVADEGLPVNSKVAVLALNGTLDPQDPPPNMSAGREVWPNSLFLQVPGQGHDIDNQTGACTAPIIGAFIARGAPTGLDTGCLQGLSERTFPSTLEALTSR